MSTYLALTIVCVTAAAFAALGVWYTRRQRLRVEDYTVSRFNMGVPVSVATVTASAVGAWILFSPAEAATWSGIAGLSGYAVGQAAPLVAFALIGPRMRAIMPNGHSLTEYTWHRFGVLMYLLVLLVMVFYMFVFLCAELTAISLVLELVADTPLLWTAAIVAAGTVIYTSYGGLRASIFTDNVQFVLIVPMLVLVSVLAVGELGGPHKALAPLAEKAPQLLVFDNRAGVAFGITLVIAILAANLFHQGYWQRVYACRSAPVVRLSFGLSAALTIPVIMLAGMFGLLAVARDIPGEQASVSLFLVALQTLPTWALMLLAVLALALVMSSMDTLLNGLASIVTTDLARFRPHTSAPALLRSSRFLTVAAAFPAVLVASRGHSVLYLFLIADLVCSAAVFPVFFGLYSKRLTGTGAFGSILAGLGVGALFFPRPDFEPWIELPGLAVHPDFRFLASFGAALAVSALTALVWSRLAGSRALFDFDALARRVTPIKG